MTMNAPAARAEGVGVAYHPFLHDALLTHAARFDFFELPLDYYSDPARCAMTDPGLRRLQAVLAARPCIWRGSALSLGSADALCFPDRLMDRVRWLLSMSPSATLVETIGFRRVGGRDAGIALELPRTEAAAAGVAGRARQAAHALGATLLLEPAPPGAAAAAHEMDEAGFLGRVAALSGCGLAIDAGRAGGAHAAIAVLSVATEAAWASLAERRPTAIVLRCGAVATPESLAAFAARARAALVCSAGCEQPTLRHAAPGGALLGEGDRAALADYQSSLIAALAGRVAAHSNWRERVDDMHKAQQIAALMAGA